MTSLMNDFGTFFNAIWLYIVTVFNWIFTTIIGEIIIFTIIIGLFFYVLYLFINMKK